MNLTDNDKREIIQLIQDNKPLPDKYRFLLFEGRDEIELLWNGKNNNFSNIVLPFQIIEHVDEPREEKEISLQGSLFDESGRQLRGWTNKLIWGNNNLILSSLLYGQLYDEIQKQGGLKLVYIDPPFDVGDDFDIEITIGGNDFEKKRNILEEIAYRDTWGKGADSFLSMIYERLILIKNLLADDGSIYIHCDWRVVSGLRLIMDEVFGKSNFQNEIIWKRSSSKLKALSNSFLAVNDYILYYSKSGNKKYNLIYGEYSDDYKKRFTLEDENGKYYWAPIGSYSEERYQKLKKEGRLQHKEGKMPRIKNYLHEGKGIPPDNLWVDIDNVNSQAKERVGYPTQKPEKLLERIIKTSSDEGDLIGDFFCGSGTTLSVAEKLNRKWIGTDLGKFAIHTSRKRLISTQRERKSNGENYRAFEILNLGKYQRDSFISKHSNDEKKFDKEKYFINLILKAYGANEVNDEILHGIKNNRYVYVGPINIHVSRLAVETVVAQCIKNQVTKVDILCFDHEQGLFPNIINEAKEKGVDISCKIIPPEVFDKRAIDKNQVVFHDVAFIEFKPIIKKNKIAIQLTGFSVDYSQEKIDEMMSELKPTKSKVILDSGQIIKISRDKNGIENKEILTKSWKDWIDYWAVDFDFENKKEIFKEKNESGEIEEKWTGDFIFENEWQSFRDKKQDIEFTSVFKEISGKKSIKVAVKVIDIFGNDTMKVQKVNL